MTHTESTLRLAIKAWLMAGQAHDAQKIPVNAEVREAFRHEQGKKPHEPLWLEVDARRGARIVKVNVEVVA